MTTDKITVEGLDNHGKPRQAYIDALYAMDDAKLQETAEQAIWLSAYASNNPRSDYHWHVGAIYSVLSSLDKVNIYRKAHKAASQQ